MVEKDYSEEYIKINGIFQYFLHYDFSQKDTVIFLHGGPGESKANFAYHFAPYFNFCNVVYYDQRGTGKTQLKNKTKADEITLEILV